MTKSLAWSFSALDAFKTCPRRYKLVNITKEVKDPPSEQIIEGRAVHKAMELAIKGEAPLPAKYAGYQPLVQSCQRASGQRLVETKWALNASFKPVKYFADDVWCRGVLDFAVVRDDRATIIDWKTGKVRDDSGQLKLFAAAMFAIHPHLNRVDTGFAWMHANKFTHKTFIKEQVPELWQQFLPEVRRLQAAVERNDFPPIPSGLCKAHCPVGRDKCEFSGRG